MQSFSLDELHRLVQLLPVTDPRTAEYQMLLRSIECLDSIGQTLDEIEERMFQQEAEDAPGEDAKVIPFTAPEFPEAPTVDPETDFAEALKAEEPKTWDPSDVRKALVDARAKGVNVKAILAKVGADNFTAVPASRYAEIMKELEVVG